MLNAFHGLYRDVGWAYATNGTMSFQVPEADYHAFGYEPAYEKLPWKDDYVASKQTISPTTVERVGASTLRLDEEPLGS